ncbi:MAG: bifunctional phosphoribosyl-AMP cyclohydrolase/phosphoribosyl-ATP diphosphatase HisIE [Flavobacteriales bacterium]|nr:bifunctional phosphoribosyl-AMP cyclohydrolase/phosphoribosyl-ATP diphosphatase HisIE [Flavobacteriales bacterium]
MKFKIEQLDFDKVNGLLPAIIQDNNTNEVLMLGYMNRESLELSLSTKKVTFYSRTKKRIWTKGETSSNYLNIVQIYNDCDNDTLLIKVNPDGPTCHQGTTSCFSENNSNGFLYELEQIICSRIDNNDDKSYTNSLFKRGINKVAQKVGEEAVELVIEAKDNDDELFKNEAADLIYHFLILLKAKNIKLNEIERVLKSRSK